MADNASRRGAVDLGMPLMILAFVTIIGFMFWLRGQAAQERALDLVEDTATVDVGVEGATTVAAVDIQMDASPFEGQMITIAGLDIASLLGTQGFWLEMPNGNPFLVSMSEAVKAEGLPVRMGVGATVSGVVHSVNDSVLTAWVDAGAIDDNDRLVAEFATHFLEAEDVRLAEDEGGTP